MSVMDAEDDRPPSRAGWVEVSSCLHTIYVLLSARPLQHFCLCGLMDKALDFERLSTSTLELSRDCRFESGQRCFGVCLGGRICLGLEDIMKIERGVLMGKIVLRGWG